MEKFVQIDGYVIRRQLNKSLVGGIHQGDEGLNHKLSVIRAIQMDLLERRSLAIAGYYNNVKHILDRYYKEGKYLIHTDVFSDIIILYYWPFDKPNIFSNHDVVHLYKGGN